MSSPRNHWIASVVLVAALGADPVRASGSGIEQVTVVGLASDNPHTIGADAIAQSHALTASDLIERDVPSAFLSDTESNPFQKDLYFHGFDASPVLGTPIGLAVYQGGARINERFGDTVVWDLVPSFALQSVDVVAGSNPIFGLNALGGAIVLNMKDGFTAGEAATFDISAGSFARGIATAEATERFGDQAVYLGIRLTRDGGWRRASSSDLLQAYGDYALHRGPVSAGLSLTLADNFLHENGAVPSDDTRTAAFSIPDTARDQLVFVQGRGEYDASRDIRLRANGFFRATHVVTGNGQAMAFAPCISDPSLLCASDAPTDPLEDQTGGSIPANVAAQGTLGIQTTRTDALGGTMEIDASKKFLGLDHTLSAGAAIDYASSDFRSATELGTLTFQPGGVTVVPIGTFVSDNEFNVDLRVTTADESLFAQDRLHLADDLSLELSGRLDVDRIESSDRLNGPLGGTHDYTSINPGATLSWNSSEKSTLYLSLGQSSRTPTPAELSCANPAAPCLFPLSFISDPGLRKVVARTATIGARGTASGGEWTFDWEGDAYFTRNRDDIIFISSGPAIGSGFFSNVGVTQRVGADASLDAKWRALDFRINYGFVNATFESRFAVPSAFNPGADANGNIAVEPGDRLPNIPRSTARIAAGYQLTPSLHVGLDAALQSSRYLRGDEANLEKPLPGFFVLNASADYRLNDRFDCYVTAENILDRHYATFGLFGDPTGGGVLPFSNPRFVVPAPPFGMWAGLRATL
jgi:outer membrane receptor protein involved in Fe transport